jgi:hypothetical protein
MFKYVKILALCTLAGYLLATIFMAPGGAAAGGAKGLLVGVLVAWGEWKSRHNRRKYVEAAPQPALTGNRVQMSAVPQALQTEVTRYSP